MAKEKKLKEMLRLAKQNLQLVIKNYREEYYTKLKALKYLID